MLVVARDRPAEQRVENREARKYEQIVPGYPGHVLDVHLGRRGERISKIYAASGRR